MEAVAIIIWLFLYFLPAIIGFSRSHRNAVAIFVLTLFLGWTGLFWVLALVWSFMKTPHEA